MIVLGEGVPGTSLIKRFRDGIELEPVACPIPGEAMHTFGQRAVKEAAGAGYAAVIVSGVTYHVDGDAAAEKNGKPRRKKRVREDVSEGETKTADKPISNNEAFKIRLNEALDARGIPTTKDTYAALREAMKTTALTNLKPDELKTMFDNIAAGKFDRLKKGGK